MTVPELSHQANEPCEEYRRRWQHSASGPAGVADFLGGKDCLTDIDRQVLLWVIQVDIEESWSRWSTVAEEQARRAVAADSLLEQWKQLPWFQNYAVLFSGPEEVALYWAQLANIEATCRDRWGDAIGTQFYQTYSQVDTVGLVRRPRRLLRCEFENNEEYSQILFPLRGRNEIGRQRSRDAEAYFCESLPNGNRIVVANRFESEVSREQMTLQLLTPAVAVIINQSSVNSIRLSPDILLPPAAKMCAVFPFTVQIPGRRLCCF